MVVGGIPTAALIPERGCWYCRGGLTLLQSRQRMLLDEWVVEVPYQRPALRGTMQCPPNVAEYLVFTLLPVRWRNEASRLICFPYKCK